MLLVFVYVYLAYVLFAHVLFVYVLFVYVLFAYVLFVHLFVVYVLFVYVLFAYVLFAHVFVACVSCMCSFLVWPCHLAVATCCSSNIPLLSVIGQCCHCLHFLKISAQNLFFPEIISHNCEEVRKNRVMYTGRAINNTIVM